MLDISDKPCMMYIVRGGFLPTRPILGRSNTMKGNAFQKLWLTVSEAVTRGIDVAVYISSTATGLTSILSRQYTDTRDSGSKCGITLNGGVVNTASPIKSKPVYAEDQERISILDLTWNPETACAFLSTLIAQHKTAAVEQAKVAEAQAEQAKVEEAQKTVEKRLPKIRRKKSAA